MKPLPYADAIREARALAETAHRATLVEHRLGIALQGVSAIEHEVLQGAPFEGELPGQVELDEAIEVLPALGDLEAAADGPIQVALAERRRRLTIAIQALRPLVERAAELAAELHELQHRQHHTLNEPEWAEHVQDLIALGSERDRHAQAAARLQTQLARVVPLTRLLQACTPLLEQSMTHALQHPRKDGSAAMGVAGQARDHLIDFANLMNQVQLAIPLAFEPMLPDRPEARHRSRLLDETQGVLVWMRRTCDGLLQTQHELEAALDRSASAHTQAQDALKERMG